MPSTKPGSSLTQPRDSSRGHPQQSCALGYRGTKRGATLASLPESLKGAPLPQTNFGGGFPGVSLQFQREHPTQPLQNILLGNWVKSSEEMSSGGIPFSVCPTQGTHLKESAMAKAFTWDRQGKKVTGVPNLQSSSDMGQLRRLSWKPQHPRTTLLHSCARRGERQRRRRLTASLPPDPPQDICLDYHKGARGPSQSSPEPGGNSRCAGLR